MKILYTADYSAWEPVFKGNMPSQHLWGVYELVDSYDNKRCRGILKKEFADGYVDFCLIYKPSKGSKMMKAVSRLISSFKVLLKSYHYDIVYDPINQCSQILGIFNRFGLLKAKLVTGPHHPPFRCELLAGRSDEYVFFDKRHKEYAAKLNPKMTPHMNVCTWGVDRKWYKYLKEIPHTEEYFCADTGHTCRDHDLLARACEKAEVTGLLPGATERNKYISILRPNWNMKEYCKVLRKCRCIVVSIEKGKFPRNEFAYEKLIMRLFGPKNDNGLSDIPYDPCGFTALMDVLALEIPIITSSDTLIADIVRKYDIGIVFKTGDLDSLTDALNQMKEQKLVDMFIHNLKMLSKNNFMSMNKYSFMISSIFKKLV